MDKPSSPIHFILQWPPHVVLLTLILMIHMVVCTNAVESDELELQKKWIANSSEILKHLTQDYDPRVAPFMPGKPVTVNLMYEILAFGEVDEANMEFSLDMYFYQYWHDVRLKKGQDRNISLTGSAAINLMWVPDTYFVNAKKPNIHDVVMENQMMNIYTDGRVQYLARISLTAHCRVELSMYPLDRQLCDLVMESFSLEKDALIYKWKDGEHKNCSVRVLDGEMAQFKYRGVSLLEHHEKLTSPGFSNVYARFVFDRRVRYTVIQTYVPSYLITVISFVGLWIPRDAVPARVGLGITTILTIVYFFGAVDSRMPNVAYMKAVDYHMFLSFAFIFASLLEYTIVLNVKMKTKRVESRDEGNKCQDNHSIDEGERQTAEEGQGQSFKQDIELRQRVKRKTNKYDVTTSTTDVINQCEACSRAALERDHDMSIVHPVDKISRILIPIAYVVLVAVYWIIYVVKNKQKRDTNEGHVLC